MVRIFVVAAFSLAAPLGAFACSSSSPGSGPSTDGGGSGSEASGDAGQDATMSQGTCGALGEACCENAACAAGLTCSLGTCEAASSAGDSGAPQLDATAPASDAASEDAAPEDAGSVDGALNDGGTVATFCGSAPTLHQESPGSLFCGFDLSGGALVCGTGQQCCLGGEVTPGVFAPETCTGQGMPCENGGDAGELPIPIACNQIADCTANGWSAVACCLQGATAPIVEPGCSYPKSSHGTAIVCEPGSGTGPSACAAGEINVCSSDADCPAGTTCVAGKWKIFQIGFCQ